MRDDDSITVIIPAFNEETTIEATLRVVAESVKKHFKEYEVIIFNDGSADKTGELSDGLAGRMKNVTAVHHRKPMGLGRVFKEGLRLAKMNYFIRINGKHDIGVESLERIFSSRGQADLVIPYQENANQRLLFRRVVSAAFTALLNALSGLRLRYYNHYVLHKTKDLRAIDIATDSYAFQAEVLIKLIGAGHTYLEVGVIDNFDNDTDSKAFYPQNIIGVAGFFLRVIKGRFFSGSVRR